MIDVLSVLERFGIEPRLSGKNVSRGWAETDCPFLGCPNPYGHLGINLKSGMFHCWVCGEKGHVTRLLTEGLHFSYKDVKQAIAEFSDGEVYVPESRIDDVEIREILPKEATSQLPDLHRRYLLNRNFDPDFLQEKYKVRACYKTGDYSYRLLIPIFEDGILVSFTCRDVTGKQEKRYMACPNPHYEGGVLINRDVAGILPIKECVFNLDTVQQGGVVLAVEGTFDVFRMGDGAVSTLGVEFVPAQIALILRKKPKKAFVLFDKGALAAAEKLADNLILGCPSVEILTIDKKDPALLSPEEALEIRMEIGL